MELGRELMELPAKWRRTVLAGVLSLPEAQELFLLTVSGEWVAPPDRLKPAVDRLLLWQMPSPSEMTH